jgi:hypothetical protein
MTGLLHNCYTPGQMTYDLRRLRLAGLIRRIGHTSRYVLTPDGAKVAIFDAKHHTGSCARCWPPTSPKHPPNSDPPCAPSTTGSTATSHAPHRSSRVKT